METRKLYRISSAGMLGGICTGLGYRSNHHSFDLRSAFPGRLARIVDLPDHAANCPDKTRIVAGWPNRGRNARKKAEMSQ